MKVKKYPMHRRVLSMVLAVVVVIGTIGAIPKSAEEYICGKTEHTHSDECYLVEPGKRVLTCTEESASGHTHTADCYNAAGELVCGYADYVLHEHDETCYDSDGNLICQLEEIPEHIHTDVCFAQDRVCICELEESEGHQHTESCYAMQETTVSASVDNSVEDEHSDNYDETDLVVEEEQNQVEEPSQDTMIGNEEDSVLETPVESDEGNNSIICGLEESEGHTHTDTCYEIQSTLTCGQDGYVYHVHDASCYEDGVLVCGHLQVLRHQHTATCFAESEPVYADTPQCGLEEHIHDETCKQQNEPETPIDIVVENPDDSGQTDAPVNESDVPTQPITPINPPDISIIDPPIVPPDSETEPEITDESNTYNNEDVFEDIGDFPEKLPENYVEYTVSNRDGLSVVVWAPKEAFEREVMLRAEVLRDSSPDYHVATAELDAAGVTYDYVTAVDIGFVYTETGEEAEPNPNAGKVWVKFDIASLVPENIDADTIEVHHIVETGAEPVVVPMDAMEVNDTDVAALSINGTSQDGQDMEVSFGTESFSIYTVSGMLKSSVFGALESDEARVSGLSVVIKSDGTTPWDENDEPGNDSAFNNRIVRTFDSVVYDFFVKMESYGAADAYTDARVKMEIVLPLSPEEASFDLGAMAWMDETVGYAPVVTTEMRTINGIETECQVLTCYKHLEIFEGKLSVVPGEFGESISVNVKSMRHGDTFAPIISAAMEYGEWGDKTWAAVTEDDKWAAGVCSEHGCAERLTVEADKVTVSAAPKYNIKIVSGSSSKGVYDFSTGYEEKVQNYGEGYGDFNLFGRVMNVGAVLQLYNDNASKGFRGIELPNGDPISFDLTLDTGFKISAPAAGTSYTQNQVVNLTTEGYLPLLWSCDANQYTPSGSSNADGRVLYDGIFGYSMGIPRDGNGYFNDYSCYNSGEWTATQENNVIHVTVSDYEIDVNKMPHEAANGEAIFGEELGIGCFSAGEIWIVQPFNKKENGSYEGPDFDVIKEYGEGYFTLSVNDTNMKATSVSGLEFTDSNGTNDKQMVQTDDSTLTGIELTLPGSLTNRVGYGAYTDTFNKGVGVDSPWDGMDFAAVGTDLQIIGGFSYETRQEEDNILYWGTNLTKFYGSAIELTTEADGKTGLQWRFDDNDFNGTQFALYATKKDGSDWENDYELLHTYEDDLDFYCSLEDIPDNKLCVGILFCFKGPGELISSGSPYYYGYHSARVRNDMSLCEMTGYDAGNPYMLASTSRVWTKYLFERKGVDLNEIPVDETAATWVRNKLGDQYKEANIEGSWFQYTKQLYSLDTMEPIPNTHNCSWRHSGDTLLVIGYKTGITKKLAQKNIDQDGNSTDKQVYALDMNQRVVDFVLQPRVTYVQQASGEQALTTTVTIVDTLPKYLKYKEGSCYFGGEYAQASPNGGTQGIVSDGVQINENGYTTTWDGTKTHLSVTLNDDGSQTLTFVIENVPVGGTMPVINYSADIGSYNPAEDVPTGTTNLKSTVRIYATNDIRAPSLENGNYAEVGIQVVRGSAFSYGKYAKQNYVERDGTIDFVMYNDNNGGADVDVLLLDAMPVNGVNGSSFDGTYTIEKWELDISKCDPSKLSFYYTTDEKYSGVTVDALGGESAAKAEIGTWTQAIYNEGNIATQNRELPVAWAVLGSLEATKSVYVEMSIKLVPDGSSEAGVSQKYVNVLSKSGTTISSSPQTISRSLEGLTWWDNNSDGIQDELSDTEGAPISSYISGIKVTLLKLREGGDKNSPEDYETFHYQGNPDLPEVIIETGQSVSVVTTGNVNDIASYEPGRYKFTDLPAGTFAVKFESGKSDISDSTSSEPNQGKDDTIDSDGIPYYDNNILKYTIIMGIEMPEAENMTSSTFTSAYNDSGFFTPNHTFPKTGGVGADKLILSGTVLILLGLLCVHSNRQRKIRRVH